MAVGIQIIEPKVLMDALSISDGHKKMVSTGLVSVEIVMDGVILTSGEHSVKVPVTASALIALSKGTAAPIMKSALSSSIGAALDKVSALSALSDAGKKEKLEPMFGIVGVAKPLQVPKATTINPHVGSTEDKSISHAALKAALAVAEGKWGVTPLAQMLTKPPVDLLQATDMYQPVHGTSKGSRYYVVALCAELKVAARLKDGALSVRASGSAFSELLKKKLQEAELTVHSNYASIHLEVGKKYGARALGALLCSMGVPFDTLMPDVSYLEGK